MSATGNGNKLSNATQNYLNSRKANAAAKEAELQAQLAAQRERERQAALNQEYAEFKAQEKRERNLNTFGGRRARKTRARKTRARKTRSRKTRARKSRSRKTRSRK